MVEVRQISRPVHDLELQLLQLLHHHLAVVAGGVVLQEPRAAVDAHEGGQVVVQNCDIPGSGHGLVLGQKVKAASVPVATETTPDHKRG
jgi:hypothetical protein